MRLRALTLLLAACGRVNFALDPGGDSVVTPGYFDTVLASAPVAYYRLDEPDGAIAHDITGHGYEAQLDLYGGSFTFGVPGGVSGDPDTALRVVGDGNAGPNDGAAIYVPLIATIRAGDFTIEMLARPDAPPPVGWRNVLFVCEHYMTNGFRFGWNQQHVFELWTNEAGGTSDVESSSVLAFQSFNHVALARKGSSFTFFLNGAALETDLLADYVPPDLSATCGFGALHGMPTYTTYDEVAIYDRVLPTAEISAHAAARSR